MKVKQLIEILQMLPDDSDVQTKIEDQYDISTHAINDVEFKPIHKVVRLVSRDC